MSRSLLFVLAVVFLFSGCNQKGPATPPVVTTSATKTYKLRAKVVTVGERDVMLDHEAVPGLMGAMTMSYKLKDPSIASELHPGDRVTADLLVTPNSDGYNDTLIDNVVVIAQAKPDYKPAVQYHVPQSGDAVPDFRFINQDGKTIHLSQFQGKVVLITFIYTRCTLDEFCPRMSRNFAEVHKSIASDPALTAGSHLLSISFDPSYDTPAVLRTYAGNYLGHPSKDTFQNWDFAAPSEKDLPALTQFFNVGVSPGDSKSLNHSLSTIVIGKDGKVAAWYPTNDWVPADIVAQLKKVAAA